MNGSVLFRWTFTDDVPSTATYSRTGTATFVAYAFPSLDPPLIRAWCLSGPSILVRDARGGTLL